MIRREHPSKTRFFVKLFLFASAVGWALVNLAGLGMAMYQGAGPTHLGTHVGLALACSVAAYFLWPWRRAQPAERMEGNQRIEVLEGEVTDLQRQVLETRRGLEFTEKLLKERPDSRKEEA